MIKRTAILGILLVVLIVLLWIGTSTGDGPVPAVVSSGGPDAPVPALDGATAALRGDGTTRAPIGVQDPNGEDGFEEPPLEGVLIRVLHGHTEEPVPGAVVSFVDCTEAARGSSRIPRLLKAFDEMVAREGRRYRADELGLVHVPRPQAEHVVVGCAEGLWGTATIPTPSIDLVRLKLFTDHSLTVRVIAPDGRSRAGVPVAVRLGMDRARDAPSDATSDPAGTVVFPHVTSLAARRGVSTAVAFLPFPGIHPVEAEVALTARRDLTCELRLPPTGALEVVVIDAQGRPSEDAYLVRTAAFEAEEEIDLGHRYFRSGRREVRRVPEGGRALFEHVELGRWFGVIAQVRGHSSPPIGQGLGPTQVGETARLEVRIEEASPELLGRILDRQGAPLGPCSWALTLTTDYQSRGQHLARSDLETDAEGRFRHVLTVAPFDGGRRSARFARRSEGEEPEVSVEVDLSHALEPGENDLGDLVAGVAPPLVSGVVVDAGGAPVAAATVEFLSGTARPDGEGVRWESHSLLKSVSNAQGRFVIRGRPGDGDAFALLASHDSYATGERVPTTPGAVNVQLVLSAGGTLVGRYLLDDEVSAQDLLVTLRRVDLTSDDDRGQRVLADEDQSFTVQSLAPGVYRLVVELASESHSIASVEGIEVRGGERTEDPRLAPLDLRGLIHVFTVTAIDERGATIPRPWLSYAGPGGDERPHLVSEGGAPGCLRIRTRHTEVDATVFAAGYRTHRLPALCADTQVTLRTGIPVRLVLRDPSAVPDRGFALAANLTLAGPGSPIFARLSFDERGEARGRLGAPGTWELQYVMGEVDEEGQARFSVFLGGDTRELIEVAESDEEQIIRVDIAPETVDAVTRHWGD